MNLSVNGTSQVPPGFRFHPTEEELLHYYLRKKVASEKIDLDVICDVDLNKLEPWDIQEKCRIGSTPQNDWYFFSHKDKKYPTGTRTNRATAAGFWKATGRDKVIYGSLRRIGMRKTLVFYMGRAPHGQKSDWIMHEYRLEENNAHYTNASDSMAEDGWVVCRVFRKKNYQKSLESPKISSTSTISRTNDDEGLDQILINMGKNFKQENGNISNNINLMPKNSIDHGLQFIADEWFMHPPRLDSPTIASPFDHLSMDEIRLIETEPSPELNHWAALDRLVAAQLNNGHVISETSQQLSCFSDPNMASVIGLSPDYDAQLSHELRTINRPNQASQIFTSEIDLWSFTRSSSSLSSGPLSHYS